MDLKSLECIVTIGIICCIEQYLSKVTGVRSIERAWKKWNDAVIRTNNYIAQIDADSVSEYTIPTTVKELEGDRVLHDPTYQKLFRKQIDAQLTYLELVPSDVEKNKLLELLLRLENNDALAERTLRLIFFSE